ncbi:MAG: tripartite tricarboxylate transporter TctB family protein [Desulfobacterales bacterium]|nr:tripartite tricarboxylate transporter TctB family protein [Desulfobacterales bacterium]
MATRIEPEKKKIFRFTDAVLYDLVILAFFITITLMSFSYNPLARSIPLGLGIIGTVMMFLQFLFDAFPGVQPNLPFITQSGILSEDVLPRGKPQKKPESQTGSPPSGKAVWWQVFRLILWLSGFIVLLGFVNYLIAVGAFIVGLTRLEAKESWKRAVSLAVCVTASFYLLFDVLLQVQF